MSLALLSKMLFAPSLNSSAA